MKVSVIVPVYNVEKCISKCLESLVQQTLKDVEIIVVNDGATDDSQSYIDEFVEKYSNVYSYYKQNGGLSDARNYGLQYATGEFIAFVDSDDYVELNMLEKMYERAVRDNLDIVVCDTLIEYPSFSYVVHSNMHFTSEDVRAYIFAAPMACTRMVRKTVMDQFSFQKGTLYEDLNLTPTYVTVTEKIGFVEEALYHYIQRDNSIMNQKVFSESLLDIFSVLAHVKEVFIAKNIFDKYHDELEYLYLIHLLRSATLRFIQYDGTNSYLKQINDTIKSEFPLWKKNRYFKSSGIKFKIVCYFAYMKQYTLLKILESIRKR